MTKTEMIKALAQTNISTVVKGEMVEKKLTVAQATEIYDALFSVEDGIIVNALMEDGEVKIPEFGKFVVATQSERVCRNPQTGEEIKVPEKNVVRFKAFDGLKESVK